MKLRYRPGVFAPGPPAGGGVIAFKWPERSPEKNPGDATGVLIYQIISESSQPLKLIWLLIYGLLSFQ